MSLEISRDKLLEVGRSLKCEAVMLEKVVRLGTILREVNEDPFLQPCLLLKGGTAINMFFKEPRRLSVDIDFGYIGAVDREGFLREKPRVELAIEKIFSGKGYRVRKGSSEHAGQKYYLSYWNVQSEQDRIQVDISYLNRVPLVPPQKLTMWRVGSMAPVHAWVCGTEELLAGKFNALLDRVAARDYFDACILPGLMEDPWPSFLLKRTFVFFSGVLNHPLSAYSVGHIDRLEQRHVDEHLGPVVFNGEELRARDLVSGAQEVIRPLLDLDDVEREYVERIQYGEFLPELLFDEVEKVEKLRQHPALLWKSRNAGEFHNRNERELVG